MENNMNTEIIGAGGKGGGGGSGAVEAPNTLRSSAIVRIVEVLSEGEIEGICGGAQGIYINDTPLGNNDGTFNFARTAWEYRVGLPSQDYMQGFPAVQAELTINTAVTAVTPVAHTTSSANIDAVKVTMILPQGLYLQDTTTGDMNGTGVNIAIDTKLSSSGTWTSAGTYTIEGKTTSPYERQYRVERPVGSGTWDVRVSRSTGDSNVASLRNATTWARMTEVQDIKLPYNDTAVVGIAIDAESVGNSIPRRSYLVKGLKVKVPTNYNPNSRTYSGLWNGTFQVLWTDNPAWVLYDILTHDRYGLGEFITESQIDKWAFFDAAVYCDGMVSNGKGGSEPRFTFNGAIAQRTDALRIIQNIASMMHAQVVYFNGLVSLTQDRPTSPVKLITKSNVIDGNFTYKSSGLFDRHTAFNVTFNDRADRHLQRVTTIDASTVPTIASTYTSMLSTAEARYGYNPTDVAAFGATTEGQAIRQGLWALDTEINQTEIASWKMSLNGFDLMPGDVVKLYDEDYTTTVGGGRIVSVVGTTVTLDRAVTLTTGSTIDVQLADGKTIETRNISLTAGSFASFTVTAGFSQAVLAGADFIVKTSAAPRQFKVISLKQSDKHLVDIEALYHDPNKYSRVEANLSVPSEIFSNAVQTVTSAPSSVEFRESSNNVNNTITRALLISWGAPTTGAAASYTLQWRLNTGTWTNVTNMTSMSYEIANAASGVYDVKVYANSAYGNQSLPCVGTYTISTTAGTGSTLLAPTALHIVGGTTAFVNASIAFQWTSPAAVTTATLKDFEVKFLDATTSTVLRTVYVASVAPTITQSFIYTFEMNQADGGPRRSVIVEVRCRDTNYKTGPVINATFTNAAISIPSNITHLGGYGSIEIRWDAVLDTDYAGTMVWMSDTTGFALSSATLVFDGKASIFTKVGLIDGATYYFKVGHYDTFSRSASGIAMNVSAQVTDAVAVKPGITVVSSLPLTGTAGQVVFLTTDNKLYRWNGTAWVTAVDVGVEVVSTLPTTGNYEGRVVFLTGDGKLYRYFTGAWTAAVPAVDIAGILTDAQVAALSASKLTGQITATQITDGAISTPKLAAGSVVTASLAASAITADKLAANSVTTVALAAGSVVANTLAVGAVTTNSILAGAITTATIAANAITGNELAANSITAGKIVAGSITGDRLFANTVTADRIDSRGLTIKDAAGTVIFSSGVPLTSSYITPASGWLNSNISLGTLGYTGATNATYGATFGSNIYGQITVGNVSTYIGSAAIGSAYIGTLAAGNIGANTISAGHIVANSITAACIDSRGLSIKDAAGTVIFASGTPLTSANITPAASWLNSNQTLGALGFTGDTNATYGANWSTNVTGASTVNTNISNAATTATWSNVSSRPANVAALSGAENINNGLITMSATGALSGAGGGQITTLPAIDTRYTNAAPNTYSVGITTEFKLTSSIGAPGSASYGTLTTEKSWSTSDAGGFMQVFKSESGTWRRLSAPGWGSWLGWTPVMDQMLTSSNISTFISSAAIGDAYINNLSASKINAGTMSADYITGNTITAGKIIGGEITTTYFAQTATGLYTAEIWVPIPAGASGILVNASFGNSQGTSGSGKDTVSNIGANPGAIYVASGGGYVAQARSNSASVWAYANPPNAYWGFYATRDLLYGYALGPLIITVQVLKR
jgi:predicted phage tail protein